eukprot:1893587-Pleurochrysis_carterae.AAC.1
MDDSSGALRLFCFAMHGHLLTDLMYEPEIRGERCGCGDIDLNKFYFARYAATELPSAEPTSTACQRRLFGAAVIWQRRNRRPCCKGLQSTALSKARRTGFDNRSEQQLATPKPRRQMGGLLAHKADSDIRGAGRIAEWPCIQQRQYVTHVVLLRLLAPLR